MADVFYVVFANLGPIMKQARLQLVTKLEMLAASIPAPTSETSDRSRRQALCTLTNLELR